MKIIRALILIILVANLNISCADCKISALKSKISQSDEPYYIYPLLPSAKDKEFYKSKPSLGQVYQWDNSPIGDRQPLLLIHGGAGEGKFAFNWEKFIRSTDKKFNSIFKIYLYRYDTKARIRDLTPRLEQSIRRLYRREGYRTISILCLSMGGNVIQASMTDPVVASLVNCILAMGSPFHGSPLFSQDWFKYSLNASPVRGFNNIGYKLYFMGHPNYQQDLKWDNMDSLIPDIGKFKAKMPLGPKGDLRVVTETNQTLKAINVDDLNVKDKFITYAGYIYNPYLVPKPFRKLAFIISLPYYILTVRLPLMIGNSNAALRYLNREMSNIKVNRQSANIKDVRQSYALNDGITPVNSAIYISNDGLKNYPLTSQKSLKHVYPYIDVRLSRVFKNVGHTSFLSGRPIRGNYFVFDQLHKNEGHHSIFKWIQLDLSNNAKNYFVYDLSEAPQENDYSFMTR